MPHYKNRPLSILRNTHGSKPFFQKHFLEKSGAGLRVVQIPNADKDPDFVVCDSPEGLLHLAQVGAVELHSWGAVMPRPTHADRLTFDLDPGRGPALSTAARRGARDPQTHAGPRARKLGEDHRRQGPARRRAADAARCPTGTPPRSSRAASRCSWNGSRRPCSRRRPASGTARTRSSSTIYAMDSAPRPSPRSRRAGVPASACRRRSPGMKSTRTSAARISTCTTCRSASRNNARIPWKDYWTAKQSLTKAMIKKMGSDPNS